MFGGCLGVGVGAWAVAGFVAQTESTRFAQPAARMGLVVCCYGFRARGFEALGGEFAFKAFGVSGWVVDSVIWDYRLQGFKAKSKGTETTRRPRIHWVHATPRPLR